jgi:hypothetical protein
VIVPTLPDVDHDTKEDECGRLSENFLLEVLILWICLAKYEDLLVKVLNKEVIIDDFL